MTHWPAPWAEHSAPVYGWHAATAATMLPRVRRVGSTGGLGLAIALGAALGCGDPQPTSPASAPVASPRAEDWAERLAAPTLADLLMALAQPHAVVRGALGPHHLETTTVVSLTPTRPPGAGSPELDSPVVPSQAVTDTLTLDWATAPQTGLSLSLSQANDHQRGRDVVVLGDTIHVRKAHRGWFHYERDSDLLESWLDDAQRAAHDAIQLAAPRLTLEATAIPDAGLKQGPAVELTLGLAEQRDATVVAAGPTQRWRKQARLTAIVGTLRLDAHSGAWLFADIQVRYSLTGADGQPLDGQLHLTGKVVPGPPGPIQAPADSQPLPQRLRYEQERRELLDGLAAP